MVALAVAVTGSGVEIATVAVSVGVSGATAVAVATTVDVAASVGVAFGSLQRSAVGHASGRQRGLKRRRQRSLTGAWVGSTAVAVGAAADGSDVEVAAMVAGVCVGGAYAVGVAAAVSLIGVAEATAEGVAVELADGCAGTLALADGCAAAVALASAPGSRRKQSSGSRRQKRR